MSSYRGKTRGKNSRMPTFFRFEAVSSKLRRKRESDLGIRLVRHDFWEIKNGSFIVVEFEFVDFGFRGGRKTGQSEEK